MVATEKTIKQLLNELSQVYTDLRTAIEQDLPYSRFSELYDKQVQLKKEIATAVGSVQLAPEEKQKVFKSDDGQVASKLTAKQPLMADVFIEDMIENHRDEFLARAKTCCDIVKKGWAQNPIEGVDIKDPKYLGQKEFEVTTTNTYKMGTVIMESLKWACDVNNVKVEPEGKTILERIESMYDGVCRQLNEFRATH